MPRTPNTVDPLLKNSVISLISLLKHKATDKNLEPVISVAKFIDILHGTLQMTITYQQLLDLAKDPNIADSIKAINKNQITLMLGDEEPEVTEPAESEEFNPDDFNDSEFNPEEEDQDDEEFSPDDFEDSSEENSENSGDEMENHSHSSQKSIVGAMASRAAHRPD